MSERRVVIIGLVVAVLLVAGIVDRSARSDVKTPTARAVDAFAARPASSPTASTWYCAIGAGEPANGSDARIAIANVGRRAVDGTLTFMPQDGAPVAVGLHLAGRARRTARVSDFAHGAAVGAVVELEAGGVAVEQTINTPAGESTAPCTSATSDRWYVADGSTALNNTMALYLLNPFPDDAIIDMDFATDQGRTAPGAFQGVVVPARSVTTVNVGEHVRRRDHVAATIKARRGRIVVGRLQTRTSPRNVVLAASGATAPSSTWDFPDGVVADSMAERVHLYNPSSRPATVQLALTLEQGAAEPLELKVPAGERLTFDPGTEPRVPKTVTHALTLRSNVPIVAERSMDYAPASGHVGLAGSLGATAPARQWILAEGAITEGYDDGVTVHNLSRKSARVSIVILQNGRREVAAGLREVRVGPGERRVFALRDVVSGDDFAVLVDASEPVVVERSIVRLGRSGISLTIGLPVLE